ncbi:MAG: hypothetical protein AAFZ07_23550 [Actinomycetota bacterium]
MASVPKTDRGPGGDREPPGAGGARLALAVAAALVAASVLLELAVGEPPADGGILTWMDDQRPGLIVLDEVLVFTGLALGAAAFTARRAVDRRLGERLAVAHGLVGLTVVMLFVTSLGGGRFVYPVHDIAVENEDSAALVAGWFYGGQHMVWLLYGTVVLAVVVAARHLATAWFTRVGVAVAVCAIVGSYPDALGPGPTLVVRLAFVAWLILLAIVVPVRAVAAPPVAPELVDGSARG